MPPPLVNASSDDAPSLALAAQKFPHTRAQLSAIYRQHKGGLLDDYETNDGDESSRISTSVVTKVVTLLGDEQEDKLKEFLQTNFGVDDSDMLEQHVLDLMHRHRDDVLRPISRPSSRASSHSTRVNPNRPDTPASLPNSPVSPMHSPVLAHAQATQVHTQFAASLPSSPISSPDFSRPLSAASSNPATLSGYRTETPSPDCGHIPRAVTPSSLRSSLKPGEDDDEDDPFDPFASKAGPRSFHPITITDFDHDQWSDTAPSNSSLSPESAQQGYYQLGYGQDMPYGNELEDPDAIAYLTDGMTPLDVRSVFGSTLAPSELEEALSQNGYDFEKAMAWLVDLQHVGHRVAVVTRDAPVAISWWARLPVPARATGRATMPVGHRLPTTECRYYLAGECLRADCRFSHDLERALCRFWLRGTCAKQDQLTMATPMRVPQALLRRISPHWAMTVLGKPKQEGIQRTGQSLATRSGTDPFAAAVKRPPPTAAPADRAMRADNLQLRTTIVAPKPSPRIKLRYQHLYMSYRARALQLGAARNACLSRAADAWRRGDGAAAKRFSREGHELNAKMSQEMAEAAGRLVRERTKTAEQAGRTCGGGLGICLGVAKKDVGGDAKLSSEERTEVMLDLHGLHSNEATEVLEEFLLALEREHFLGLGEHTGTQDPARGASRARLSAGRDGYLYRP
ncbi:hypothetical protein EDD16DRAFT_1654684 [Pisolithus croceorrhizus]|nr:hypothetical protein EDD16DRAFT_1654684 [Pisolithus croceorrhizus]